MTLADMLNAPSEIEYGGRVYKLRKPTLLEEGAFQRWLEQRAYDAIERRTYQDPEQQDRDRRNLNNDVAAGVFEYGGEVSLTALRTPGGSAKIVQIVLADQGVDDATARGIVDAELKKVAAALIRKATDDPKALAATLSSLGLPSDYFSSNSATPPSTTTPHPSAG